jgi:hypothetical protein
VAKSNRHRAVLRQYLYLVGALDMGAVERTVQASIGAGVASEVGEDAYQLLLQLAFQVGVYEKGRCSERGVGWVSG